MANGGNGHVASDPADPVPRDGTIALAGGLPESSADEPGNWLVSSVQERRSDLLPRAGSPPVPPGEPSPRGAGLRQRRSSTANDRNVFAIRRDLALVGGEDRVSSGSSLLAEAAVYKSDQMQQNGDARRKLSTVGALQSPAGPVWTRTGSMASSSVGRLSSAEGVGRSGSLGRASSDGEERWKEEEGNEAGFGRATSSLAGAGSEFGRLGSLPASVESEMAERQDSMGQGGEEFAGSRQGLELRHAHHLHAPPADWSPAGRRFRLSKLGASTGSIPTSGASNQGKHDQMHQHVGYPGGGQGGGQGQPFTLTPGVSGGSGAGPTPSDASGQSGSFESEGDEGYSWMAPPVVDKPPESYAHGSVQDVFTRMASSVGIVQMDETPGQKPKLSNFLQKHSFAGPEQLDNLLSVLRIKCDLDEKEILLDAFTCPVCDAASLESAAACTTTSDQIRAVWEAFRLIDADGDGYITLMDLSDIASWAPDDFGTDFINDLIAELYKQSQGASEYNEDNTPVNGKDFLLAFAHCLKIGDDEDVEEVLEKRAHEYRRIGKLFGLERVQNFFNWRKFWLTFMSDSLAVVALPLCVVLDLLHVTAGTTEDGEKKSLYDLLTESQWLPVGYISYDSFQYYLMKLWMPSLFSVMVYCIWNSSMQVISPSEVLSPIAIYLIIGTYISTISGFEPARLVRRRLNPAISESIKQNELQAIFAFRAHTPEGHLVDQIGAIADVLFATRYRWFSNKASAIAGVVHALMPFVHRMFKWFRGTQGADFPWWSQVYFWVCGGNGWLHAFVSIPTSAVSGYLTYRLLFITSSGFYNDLAFYYKLRLFRASTQAELFLRLRAAWLRALPKGTARTEFIQFLNLQKHDDLLLWCRIRQVAPPSRAPAPAPPARPRRRGLTAVRLGAARCLSRATLGSGTSRVTSSSTSCWSRAPSTPPASQLRRGAGPCDRARQRGAHGSVWGVPGVGAGVHVAYLLLPERLLVRPAHGVRPPLARRRVRLLASPHRHRPPQACHPLSPQVRHRPSPQGTPPKRSRSAPATPRPLSRAPPLGSRARGEA
jgi:hypothetical protein